VDAVGDEHRPLRTGTGGFQLPSEGQGAYPGRRGTVGAWPRLGVGPAIMYDEDETIHGQGRVSPVKFAPSSLTLTSPAFAPQGLIPAKYTGEGQDVSPPLAWTNAPAGTRAFVLFCHDPDAPVVSGSSYGFVHWVLYNIPGDATSLAEGAAVWTPGLNDWGREGYGGPMPPAGHGPHHYYFWIVALDQDLALERGLTLAQVLPRIEPHVLGMNRLVGIYERR